MGVCFMLIYVIALGIGITISLVIASEVWT